jgi:hypothetical protein
MLCITPALAMRTAALHCPHVAAAAAAAAAAPAIALASTAVVCQSARFACRLPEEMTRTSPEWHFSFVPRHVLPE